jgi:hypothetical protein
VAVLAAVASAAADLTIPYEFEEPVAIAAGFLFGPVQSSPSSLMAPALGIADPGTCGLTTAIVTLNAPCLVSRRENDEVVEVASKDRATWIYYRRLHFVIPTKVGKVSRRSYTKSWTSKTAAFEDRRSESRWLWLAVKPRWT